MYKGWKLWSLDSVFVKLGMEGCFSEAFRRHWPQSQEVWEQVTEMEKGVELIMSYKEWLTEPYVLIREDGNRLGKIGKAFKYLKSCYTSEGVHLYSMTPRKRKWERFM